MILVFSVAKANVMLAMGNFSAAITSCQNALRSIEGKSIRTGHVINLYYDLVLAELELGDLESAKHHYKEGQQLVNLSPNWWIPRFDFLRGLLLTMKPAPDYAQAEERFQKSIKVDEEVGAAVPAAQTRYYLARMCACNGEVGRAREMFTELLSEFQNWDIPVWLQRCEKEFNAL